MEVTAEKNLQGERITQNIGYRYFTGCAMVTVTPESGFPKTIVIDFGVGCTRNGILRSGKINIVLSDSVRRPGATSVMTFANYFVNGYKRAGIITWTNTSTSTAKGWKRKIVDGIITAPEGSTWTHNGLKDVVESAGYVTPSNPRDDEFLITGNGSTINSNGVTRSHRILEPLLRKTSCENIVSGRKRIEGPNHFAIIDYGDGACDRIATISINGRPPRTILFR